MEGNLNYKFFKTLRGARIFVLQVRNTKPFDMCLEYSKANVASFFLDFGDLFEKLSHLRFMLCFDHVCIIFLFTLGMLTCQLQMYFK